jgi:pSer/pThr/pTyr-binding forkhead associated (FHA) protein
VRVDDLYSAICREALESRQRDVMTFVDNGIAGMSTRLEKTLLKLPSGYYLLGLGPYNAGLVRLEFEELLLGREVPEFIGVGMPISGFRVSSPDAFLNTEVSRLHAKVIRRSRVGNFEYRLIDMRSTCGTYLNGEPIAVPDDLDGISEEDCAAPLTSGDFFSLGPSNVNLFLFFQKDGGRG